MLVTVPVTGVAGRSAPHVEIQTGHAGCLAAAELQVSVSAEVQLLGLCGGVSLALPFG